MAVYPDSSCDPYQRRSRHRPADESKHAQAEPNISPFAMSCFEHLLFLRANPATENDSTFRRLSFVRFSHVGTQKTALEIQPLVLPVQNERSFLVHPDSETRSRRRHGVCPDPGRRWHSVQKPRL